MTIEVTVLNCVLVFLIVAFSGFIHSSTGFGFSVFGMTLMPLILPYITSAAINKLAMFVLTLLVVGNLRKHVNFKFILLPCVCALIGTTIGFYILMNTDVSVLNLALGIVLVVMALYMFFFNGKIKMKKSIPASIIMGLLSGLMGGVFNLSGVVLVVYYFSVLDDKLEYASSLQATFIATSLWGIILNIIYGNYSMDGAWVYVLIAIAAVAVGCIIGLKVLKKINKATIGKLSYSYMIIMGIALIIDLPQLLQGI